MERYVRPHTLFYLDPPYWETEGYGVDFGLEQYERMAALLPTLKGKAIISLNDHPEIRRVSAAFEMDTVPIFYGVGGGGRAVSILKSSSIVGIDRWTQLDYFNKRRKELGR